VPPSGPVRPPTVARERKPALAALALLLIAVGVLASVYLQMQAGNRIGVIQLTQQVPQGQQIPAADITEIMVAQDSSISYVTWAQRDLLTKYTAQTTLVRGTILVGQMLTTSPSATVNAYYVGPAQGSPVAAGASATATTSVGNANSDVFALLSSSVTVVGMPSGGGGAFSGGSGTSGQVFTVSVDKGSVGALLTASAEGDLVFTSGAGG
jgi:hypothetical protein